MAKSKPAKPEKPKIVSPTRVKLSRRYVEIKYDQGAGSFAMKESDNPLPSFPEAMQALAPLVSLICHFPEKYSQEGLRVTGIDVGSKGGARSIVIHAKKHLDDSSKQFEISTPERLLEHPTEEGSFSPPLTDKEAALVWEVIEEACKYVRGQRAQGTIDFDDGSGTSEDDADGDKLPGMEGADKS